MTPKVPIIILGMFIYTCFASYNALLSWHGVWYNYCASQFIRVARYMQTMKPGSSAFQTSHSAPDKCY